MPLSTDHAGTQRAGASRGVRVRHGSALTPKPASDALVRLGGGTTPWLILQRLLELARSSGDPVADPGTTADTVTLSNNAWHHDGHRYEVNSFHLSVEDRSFSCYELYGANPDAKDNVYVEVRIPDVHPAGARLFLVPRTR